MENFLNDLIKKRLMEEELLKRQQYDSQPVEMENMLPNNTPAEIQQLDNNNEEALARKARLAALKNFGM